jgi:hypothetical protein
MICVLAGPTELIPRNIGMGELVAGDGEGGTDTESEVLAIELIDVSNGACGDMVYCIVRDGVESGEAAY